MEEDGEERRPGTERRATKEDDPTRRKNGNTLRGREGGREGGEEEEMRKGREGRKHERH